MIVEKCERKATRNSKQMIKSVRRLMRLKRQIKKLRLKATSKEKRRQLKLQESLIGEYIVLENAKEQGNRIKKTVEEIKKRGGG